jgi:hypothetical protein
MSLLLGQSVILLPPGNSVAFGVKQTWTELHSRNEIYEYTAYPAPSATATR